MKWTLWKKDKAEIKEDTNCVTSCILCAMVFAIKQKCEVRIAVFNLHEGLDHVQAQAEIDGKWVYITEYHTGKGMAVKTYKKNSPSTKDIEPYRYYGLLEFMEQQKEALGLKI